MLSGPFSLYMNRFQRSCLIVFAVLPALLVHAETLTLSTGWLVQSSAKVQTAGNVLSTDAADVAGWYEATVPSTLMGVLTANGVEPEALTAEDYQRIDKKRFDVSWWYRTTFTISRVSLKNRVLLSFDGICYRANIWLNGHLVAGKDEVVGTFRQFSFDVSPYVREQNVLAVEVFRAQPGEPNIGFVDWNPRPADESMGLFREVKIKTCGDVSVSHSSVRSRVNTETLQEAWLTIDAELKNLTDKPVTGVLRGTFNGRLLTTPVTLKPYEHRMVVLGNDIRVEKPRLWWCHTLGKPELYDLHMEFEQDGVVSDAEDVRFGIRDIKSHLTPEGYRAFTLNGRDVLLRGAGWTDDIYLRDTPERNRQQLEYVRDMNMNTVRLEGFWGTSQSLYDLCDELGLLLLAGWSCHWEWEEYLGSPCDPQYGGITSEESIRLISKSFADQVLWLRHHPSIIAWFVGSDRLPVPDLEQHYRQFLATCDDRPVVISAKQMKSTISGFSGTKMEGPYDYVAPAYWYDPQAPGGAFGFNTETGVGAQLPVRESLQKMLRGTLWPVDARWNVLCTASSSEMNTLARLTAVIDARFGPSKTIDDYLHRADLLSYEGTKAMFESFRINVPRATGIIQWMLNSARPSIYWQLYDYYLQPNAAYYAVKRGNQPVQLIYDYQRRAVFAVNETLKPVTLKASMRCIDGAADIQNKTILMLKAGAVAKAFDVPAQKSPAAFLFLKATDSKGQELAVNDYFLPSERDEYDWKKTDWVTTPITRYASYRALDNLPRVDCLLTSKRVRNGYELTLKNPSSTVAFFQRLKVKDATGRLVCPAYWSDNYVTLAPGESRTITCMLPANSKDAAVRFEVEGFASSVQGVNYNVVPMPQQVTMLQDDPFVLDSSVQILAADGLSQEAEFLQSYLREQIGMSLTISRKREKKVNYIELSLLPRVQHNEGYWLNVNKKGVTITGSTATGVFYGIQTLRKALAEEEQTKGGSVLLPAVNIVDAPRFSWRGMHLDCSRHFFPITFVKKYIDLLAMHNMNVFHWHLSDDQGWRIEIKKWPKLISVGSQRTGTIIGTNSDLDDHIPYGGYYTQDEAREIVAYAAARHITVVPEIDMPGHMLAALASYPELGCTGGPYQVGHYWGVYKDVLCVANERVYQFVEDVLTEIMDIFPSEVIHIGGDEAPTEKWEQCPKCQSLGLPKEQIQSRFTHRVFNFLIAHHRRALGWDEILEGCPQNAMIMSWRGTAPGAKAAEAGHDVVMAPTTHCYFDYQQAEDRQFEPTRCGGFIPIERVYSLDPAPDSLSASAKAHILGTQANLWTEYIVNEEMLEYQALPRMSALAEVQWTQPARKDYDSFIQRLTRMTQLFERKGYTYAKHLWPERQLPSRWLF